MSQQLLRIAEGPPSSCILCWERQTFSREDEASPSKSQIAELLGIEIEVAQLAQICSICASKIVSFYEFRESVRQNFILSEVKVKVEAFEMPVEPELLTVEPLETPRVSQVWQKTTPKKEVKVDVVEGSCRSRPKKGKKRVVIEDDKDTKFVLTEQEIADEDAKIRGFFNLSCRYCDDSSSYETFSLLKVHVKQTHNVDRPFIECCNIKLFGRGQIVGHLTLHTNPDAYKCSFCGRQCKSKHRLKEHVLSRHSDNASKKFKCDKCDRSFPCKQSIIKHATVHLSAEDRAALKAENTCSQCGLGFLNNAMLAYHIRQRHEGAYSCVCDICAKSFKTKQNFIAHYRTNHTATGTERKQCPICNQWLAIEGSLRRHIKNMHQNPGPHICSVCGKEAPTGIALKKHVEYVHNDERKFACSMCDKAFKRKIGLKEHMTTHIGGALYSCPFCEKSFNSSANMYSHKKRAHPMLYEASKAAKRNMMFVKSGD